MARTGTTQLTPDAGRLRRRSVLSVTLSCLLLAGCQQQMARQPSYRPLEPSAFFPDGMSARPLPFGTVARGQQREEMAPVQRRNNGAGAARAAATVVGLGAARPLGLPAVTQPVIREQALAGYAERFPVPLTRAVLERGRERYTIFCAVCHGRTGQGDGKIVERGYTRPPSLVTDESRGLRLRGIRLPLRETPVGYYFEVISRGFGAMPDYAAQVPPSDRWAIIAYIRALQTSQYTRLADLPPAERQAALSALEAKRERGNKPSS